MMVTRKKGFSNNRNIRKISFLFLLSLLVFVSGTPVFADINVTVAGPGGSASQALPDEGGSFDLNIPLNRNAVNTITVTAEDASGNTASEELAVTQVSLDAVVVSQVTAERLSVEEVEELVAEGVIDLDDPENYHVSTFDIVLTIANEPVSVRIPIALPKEEPKGWETYKMPKGGDSSSNRPKPRPREIVVFEELLPGPPGQPDVSIPGVIVIEGNIKSLKEFFSVRLLLMNTSGIFTLSDVTANIEFPEGGLTSISPADGIASFGEIFPGDGGQPGQKEKEFIIRGDEIGVRDVRVNFGGLVRGPGIDEDDPIPFNGSAMTEVEVKGPPTFDVQVTHPDYVTAYEPYELEVRITNTADIAAMYASLEIDVGADGELVNCELDENDDPVCTPIEGSDVRSLGHILPGERVTEVFTVNPLRTGSISSCIGAADQNISLQVLVGVIGCMVGQFPPDLIPSDGTPAVTVLPVANATGIHPDSPATAFFSELMDTTSITTGDNGTFNVFDSGNNLVAGQLRFTEVNEKTVAIWQSETGSLEGNTEYTVVITRDIVDLEGNHLANRWDSTFTTTGTGLDDTTPPTISLSVEPPVDPNYVLPGQIIEVNAYTADQGSGVARVEARIRDLNEAESQYVLIDQKTVFEGNTPPFIFSIDSANLNAGHVYQLMITAYDAVGNAQNATISLIIAATADPPTITLPEDPADPVLHGISVDVTPAATTGGTRAVRFYLDSETIPFKTVNLAPYQASLRTLGLALGEHTVRAVAEDGLGQTGEDALTFTLAENLNMPTVNFGSAVDGAQYVSGEIIPVVPHVEDETGIATVRYFLDDPAGSPIYTGLAPINLDSAGLGLGAHAVYVVATNNVGVSNDPGDPDSYLEFSVVEPPPGVPPDAPAVTTVSYPEDGEVTVQGTTEAHARVDITNVTKGLAISISANGAGSFSFTIGADAGDTLSLVAYNLSESPDPSAATEVIVPAPPVLDHIEVSPAVINFTAVNQYQDLTVTGHYQDTTTANLTSAAAFSSDSPSVASVNSSGRVVGLAYGLAAISVEVDGHTATVSVNANIITLDNITVDPASVDLIAVGQTQQLTVTGHYSDGSSEVITGVISYISGDLDVATVNSSGLVTAAGDGSTGINVYRSGLPAVSVPVTVDISLDPAPTADILSPADGTDVERGDSIAVTVNAQDTLGGVIRVYLDVVGETTYSEIRQVSPASLNTTEGFNFTVSGTAAVEGTITVNAWAEDTSGNTSVIDAITLNVADDTAPSVSITGPTQQSPYNYGDTVTVNVSAADDVGVTQIRYETTGALTFSGSEVISPALQAAAAEFSFVIPFGVQAPDVRILAYAVDGTGNEGTSIPVDIILTDADITPPVTMATAVTDPESGTTTVVSYEVADGLDDLDHVELYFRRDGIGTFNRYTGPDGDTDGHYVPQSGNEGTIPFDSVKMGGDGDYEFYTVGVDLAGNREQAPDDGAGSVLPDQTELFSAGTVWTVISAPNDIGEGDTTYDNQNLRIDGTTVTIDGSHAFQNIELINGAVLNHSETDTVNEFEINLQAWTLTVDGTSAVDVTGRGFLGGNRSGLGETAHTVGFAAGAEAGNGGSYGGLGGHYGGSGSNQSNPVYGNLTNPVDLGSGGGAWAGNYGGDGGGRIFISAVNIVNDGVFAADGGESQGSAAGDGSGGSINITTRTLSGSGSISANGGGNGNSTGAGGGRVAVRYLDISSFGLSGFTAQGGDGSYGDGADGTIYLLQEDEVNGDLVINGQGPGSPYTDLIIPSGQTFNSITLQNGARVIAQDAISITGTLILTDNSELTHPTADEAGLVIDAARVVVEAGSAIDASGRGYLGGNNSGIGETAHTLRYQPGAEAGNGGSYGGRGAWFNGSGGNESNLVYGDVKTPDLLGSGGGAWSGNSGGTGGGYVRIRATDEVQVDGAIRSNGGESHGSAAGDGSGGSVWITTSRLGGDGEISADGGGSGDGAGAGGGRIALYVDYVDSSADLNGLRNITAFRGRGSYDHRPSSAGTVYMKYSTQVNGNLIIDDNMTAATSPRGTPLPLIGFGTTADITATDTVDDTLTTDGIVPMMPSGLQGIRLNPDVTQEETFEIETISGTMITVVTPNDNGVEFGDVADIGDTYAAEYVFDNIEFRRGGHLEVGDILEVADTVDIKEFGLLTHPETTGNYEGRLDLTAGTLMIDMDSRIDVTGRGYLGGNRSVFGQSGTTAGFTAGSDAGNGGSHGGLGGHYGGSGGNQPNPIYGSLTDPVDLGSGGGAWAGNYGGDGGGRIFITAGDIVNAGEIAADGGESEGSAAGDGSGGSVNITTGTLSGAGLITASGGGSNNNTGGGGGRIAIRYSISQTLPEANIESLAGVGSYDSGGDGTIFIKGSFQSHGNLIIDGMGITSSPDRTVIPGGLTFDNITIRNNGVVTSDSGLTVNDTLLLSGNSSLTHSQGNEAGLVIDAARVVVEAGSVIDVSGRGYLGGNNSGIGETAHTLHYQPGAEAGNGGSYGGHGAWFNGSGGNESNLVYGDIKTPDLLGSGGGAWAGNRGGTGGGYVRVRATDEVQVDGAIRSNGGENQGSAAGDGSGGSVWITTSRLGGDGEISADGGGGGNGAGGGGGRIALYVDYVDSGADLNGLRNITAFRGRGSGSYDDRPSSAGTVYMKYSTQVNGNLIIDDNMTAATSPRGTPLPLIGFGTTADITATDMVDDTLTTDGIVPMMPSGLQGIRLNPDVTQEETFEIETISGTMITVVTPNDNGVEFGDVADIGDTYAAEYVFDNIEFRRGGHLEVGDILEVTDTLDIKEFGLLTHPETTGNYEARLDLTAGTLMIDMDSRIDVTGRGYLGGNRTGLGETGHTVGFAAGSEAGNGGSHGGLGGHYSSSGANQANPIYGSLTDPVELGSGGGAWASNYGGDGGGRIFITAGDIANDGEITANGGESQGSAAGDGSGGTVNITTGTLSGAGLITANGGGNNNSTGGGGGRIAIRYSVSQTLPEANIESVGGIGSYDDGEDGTVYIE